MAAKTLASLLLVLVVVQAVQAQKEKKIRVFYGDRATGQILGMDEDGTNVEVIVSENVGKIVQLLLDDSDEAAPVLYWTDEEGGRVMYAAADGSQPTGDVLWDDGLITPHGLRLWNNRLYISDVAQGNLECNVTRDDLACGGIKWLDLAADPMQLNSLITLNELGYRNDVDFTPAVYYKPLAFDIAPHWSTSQDTIFMYTCAHDPDTDAHLVDLNDLHNDPATARTRWIDQRMTEPTGSGKITASASSFWTHDMLVHDDLIRLSHRGIMEDFEVDELVSSVITTTSRRSSSRRTVLPMASPMLYQLAYSPANDRMYWAEGMNEKSVYSCRMSDCSDVRRVAYTGLGSQPSGVAVGMVDGASGLVASLATVVACAAFALLML